MKNFFLEGEKFVGKSTLIQTELREAQVSIGGFYVKRRQNESGQIMGFELRAAKELMQNSTAYGSIDEHCFIQTIDGKKLWNIGVFETFGQKLLREAMSNDVEIILLDEIGGIELLSKPFVQELLTVMRQSKKIVGVFKSEENYQTQKKQASEPLEIDRQREQLKHAILNNGGQLLTLDQQNKALIERQFMTFLKE